MRGLILMLLVTTLGWFLANPVNAQTLSADSTSAVAQTNQATLQQPNLRADSIQNRLKDRTDSIHDRYQKKIGKLDSLQAQHTQDNIVKRSSDKVDSLQSEFYQRSDSLKNVYKNKIGKLDAARSSLQNKADSLTTLKLPANKITARIDSLDKVRAKVVADFDKKLQSIKDQTTSKLKKLDLPPEVSEKLNAVTKNIEGVNISSNLNVPNLDVPNNINGLPNVGANPLPSTGLTEQTGNVNVPGGVGEVKQLANVSGKVSEVTNVTGQVSEYSNEAQQIAKGNLDEAKNLPKTAEEKGTQLSGIKEMEQQTKGLDEYKAMTGKAQDSEALKKEAVEKAKKVAVNHFAGKEEQLKAAMEKISKYKQKYSSMKGLSDLSKKPRNQMHGKPLIERIVPGLALQFQKKGEDFLVDFNPYAGYRFTTKLRAGVGWNQRLAYNFDQRRFNPDARVYGPRVFGEYKLGKGFSPRAEVEVMNTRIPPLLATIDPSKREWVWGAFVGMKKEYKLVKNVKGTAMVMVRLFNPEHKSPYADVLNVRMGFEFPMKKKVKQ